MRLFFHGKRCMQNSIEDGEDRSRGRWARVWTMQSLPEPKGALIIMPLLRSMSPQDYHLAHVRERFDVAADWVVFHLIDHEVEHRVRLSGLRDLFR